MKSLQKKREGTHNQKNRGFGKKIVRHNTSMSCFPYLVEIVPQRKRLARRLHSPRSRKTEFCPQKCIVMRVIRRVAALCYDRNNSRPPSMGRRKRECREKNDENLGTAGMVI